MILAFTSSCALGSVLNMLRDCSLFLILVRQHFDITIGLSFGH